MLTLNSKFKSFTLLVEWQSLLLHMLNTQFTAQVHAYTSIREVNKSEIKRGNF